MEQKLIFQQAIQLQSGRIVGPGEAIITEAELTELQSLPYQPEPQATNIVAFGRTGPKVKYWQEPHHTAYARRREMPYRPSMQQRRIALGTPEAAAIEAQLFRESNAGEVQRLKNHRRMAGAMVARSFVQTDEAKAVNHLQGLPENEREWLLENVVPELKKHFEGEEQNNAE